MLYLAKTGELVIYTTAIINLELMIFTLIKIILQNIREVFIKQRLLFAN